MAPTVERKNTGRGEELADFRGEKGKGEAGAAGAMMGYEERPRGSGRGYVDVECGEGIGCGEVVRVGEMYVPGNGLVERLSAWSGRR